MEYRDPAIDDLHDVFADDEPLEGAGLPTLYPAELIERVLKIATENPGTIFWVYHSVDCRPPKALVKSNIVIRASPSVRDGLLCMIDQPMDVGDPINEELRDG